jgi:hypothetical protein
MISLLACPQAFPSVVMTAVMTMAAARPQSEPQFRNQMTMVEIHNRTMTAKTDQVLTTRFTFPLAKQNNLWHGGAIILTSVPEISDIWR